MKFKIGYAFIALAMNACAQHVLEQGLSKLTVTGGTLTNGNITFTGTDNWLNNQAISGSVTTLDEIDLYYNVMVNSLDKNGNFRYGAGKQAGLAGTYVEVAGDGLKSKIIVNRLDGSKTIPIKEYDLPFNIHVGVTYSLHIGKRIRSLIVELTEGTNHFYNDSLKYPSPFFGCLWGNPLIACSSGNISVSGYTLSTPLNLSPRLFVTGDSFIEGGSLEDVKQRYISLVKDSIGAENISISGKGGESSSTVQPRFFSEKAWFNKAVYHFIAIGVNDLYFDTWKANMTTYINDLKKSGIVPIITTLTPRSDRKDFIAAANKWIRETYDGAYIDLSKVVSQNDVDWIAGSSLSDNIHPTVESHKKMFFRLADDAPYLFRNKKAFTIDYLNESSSEKIPVTLQYANTAQFTAAVKGTGDVIPLVPGTMLYFSDLNKPVIKNIYDILLIPDRPGAPGKPSLAGSAGMYDWTNTPGFDQYDDYEYSEDTGLNWATCTEKPIQSNAQRLLVRVKASVHNFKSNALLLERPDGIEPYAMDLVQVYPNPAANQLMIKHITETGNLSVYTSDGKLVYTTFIQQGDQSYDVRSFSNGSYLVVIDYTSGRRKQFKLLIEH